MLDLVGQRGNVQIRSPNISAGVDGGLSGGSGMHRPGSEDPHRRQRNFYYLFWRISPSFWWYLDRLWVRSTKINESEQLIFDLLVCHLSLTWLCLIHSCYVACICIWSISGKYIAELLALDLWIYEPRDIIYWYYDLVKYVLNSIE